MTTVVTVGQCVLASVRCLYRCGRVAGLGSGPRAASRVRADVGEASLC